MLRKLGVVVASLTMVLVTSLVMVLVPATQATATGGQGGAGTSDGGGNKGDDKGDSVDYPPDPNADIYETVKWTPPPTGSTTGHMCPVDNGRDSIGYTIQWKHITDEEYAKDPAMGNLQKMGGKWYQRGTLTCNYGADPTETDVNCADTVTIEGIGPISDPSARTFPKETRHSDWSKNSTSRKDPGLCASSVSQKADVKFRRLGRYKMDVTVTLVPCTRVDYPDGNGTPYIKDDCGPPTSVFREGLAQQWCDGHSQDWSVGSPPHTFTMAECAERETPKWSCTVASVKLGALGGSHSVLDDGKVHRALWRRTSLRGPGIVGRPVTDSTTVTLKEGGTPSRPDALQGAATQPYQGVPGTDPVAGDRRTMDLQWHRPSMPGKSWWLDRFVTISADFLVETVTTISMDLTKDKDMMLPPDVDTTQIDDTIDCPSAALEVTVKRAHNVR